MPKLKTEEDLPAILCNEMNLGHLSEALSDRIQGAALKVMGTEYEALHMLREIAFRVGYYSSSFLFVMSESTYKKKKAAIRRELWKICKEVFK